MLDSLRQATSGITAKIFLGLIVISFMVWGVSGQFVGYGLGTAASVGNAEVTTQEFSRALNVRLQELGRQLNRGVSMEQARALGVPDQVLAELVSEAALDNQAMRYNLGVSEDRPEP